MDNFLLSATVLCCYAAIMSVHYGTITLLTIPGRRDSVSAFHLKVSSLMIKGVFSFQPFSGLGFSATEVLDCEAL